MSKRLKNLVTQIKLVYPEYTIVKNVEFKLSKRFPKLLYGIFTLASENKE